jgi:hypothetical protein
LWFPFLRRAMTIILRPTNLHWIKGAVDDPADLCAHSPVDFRIDDVVLVSPTAGDWTVSAAALYLLRTLEYDDTRLDPVGEHLFPCCGHSMYDIDGEEDVAIAGCCNGIDFQVTHSDSDVVVVAGNDQIRVPFVEWKEAVCAFSDAVRAFYERSSPKQRGDDLDWKGFQKFWSEWSRRRIAAEKRSCPTIEKK